MLSEMTSRQVSEWQIITRDYEPIDSTWMTEYVAQIHELLQHLVDITIRANSGDGKSGFKFQSVPRPYPVEKEKPKELTPEEKAKRQAEIDRFNETLAERNRKRGYSIEDVQERMRERGLLMK